MLGNVAPGWNPDNGLAAPAAEGTTDRTSPSPVESGSKPGPTRHSVRSCGRTGGLAGLRRVGMAFATFLSALGAPIPPPQSMRDAGLAETRRVDMAFALDLPESGAWGDTFVGLAAMRWLDMPFGLLPPGRRARGPVSIFNLRAHALILLQISI